MQFNQFKSNQMVEGSVSKQAHALFDVAPSRCRPRPPELPGITSDGEGLVQFAVR